MGIDIEMDLDTETKLDIQNLNITYRILVKVFIKYQTECRICLLLSFIRGSSIVHTEYQTSCPPLIKLHLTPRFFLPHLHNRHSLKTMQKSLKQWWPAGSLERPIFWQFCQGHLARGPVLPAHRNQVQLIINKNDGSVQANYVRRTEQLRHNNFKLPYPG
jgi:hypothetical protein